MTPNSSGGALKCARTVHRARSTRSVDAAEAGFPSAGFRSTGRGSARHARRSCACAGRHALVLSLAYFVYLGRAGYSTGLQWLTGALLLAGVLAQSPEASSCTWDWASRAAVRPARR